MVAHGFPKPLVGVRFSRGMQKIFKGQRQVKVKDLFSGVWTGKPLKIRDLYSFKDLEKIQNSNVSAQTITIKNNSTGEIVGKRTIYQK